MSKKKRIKAGTSKAAAEVRRRKFRAEYLRNGGNGYQAAVAAGYKPGRGAEKAAERLSGEVGFKDAISQAAEQAWKIAGLDLNRTLREVARVAYSDPRKFYDKDGNLIPVNKLDDDTAATVASVEVEQIRKRGRIVGKTVKLKHWDKNAALEKAMKYHGLYEKDNRQKPAMGPLEVRFVR